MTQPSKSYVEIRELIAFVAGRGYSAERLFNTVEMDIARYSGLSLRVVGIILRSPRGHKGCIPLRNGMVDLDAARLWCDSVDHAMRNPVTRR